MEDEGPILVDVFHPLSLGIGRKDRCELAGLGTYLEGCPRAELVSDLG